MTLPSRSPSTASTAVFQLLGRPHDVGDHRLDPVAATRGAVLLHDREPTAPAPESKHLQIRLERDEE